MPPALIASAQASGATGGTTPSIDITGASLVVIAASIDASTVTPSISDSVPNTIQSLTPVGGASPPYHRSRLYYVENPTTDPAYQVTMTGNNIGFAVAAFSGMKLAGVFVDENGTPYTAVESAQAGAVVPTGPNSLIISALGFDPGRTPTIGSGFTIAELVAYSSGVSYGLALAYKLQNTSADPVWDWTGQGNTQGAVAVAAVFAGLAGASKYDQIRAILRGCLRGVR
jgi:hypothetical protein